MTDHYSIKKERNVHSFKLSHYSIVQLHKLAKEDSSVEEILPKRIALKYYISPLYLRFDEFLKSRANATTHHRENDAFIKFVNKKRGGGGGGYKFRREDRAKDKRETMKGEGVNSCNVK